MQWSGLLSTWKEKNGSGVSRIASCERKRRYGTWRAGMCVCKAPLQMSLEEVLTHDMSGYDENGEAENAMKEMWQNNMRDDV